MERGTFAFWALIGGLLCASTLFGVGAERQRRELQAAKGSIATGDEVELVNVIDGDTVLMRADSGENVTIRVVGVKAFDASARDDTGSFGQGAIDQLRRTLEGKRARVELNDPPRDAHGRTLATLFVAEEDVGLALVRSGMTLVYTVHPFPAMGVYLQEQSGALSERRGLWANDAARTRAQGLSREWSARAK